MRKTLRRILGISLVLILTLAAGLGAEAGTRSRRRGETGTETKASAITPGYYLVTSFVEDGEELDISEFQEYNIDLGIGIREGGTGCMVMYGEYSELTWDDKAITTVVEGDMETVPYTYDGTVLTLAEDGYQMTFELSDRPIPTPEEAAAQLEAFYELIGAENGGDEPEVDVFGGEDDNYIHQVAVGGTYELMEAIADDTSIYLLPGEYDLTGWIEANFDDIPDFNPEGSQAPGVYKQEVFDGYEVVIYNIDNLSIMSVDPEDPAHIVCKPRYADVLNFNFCYDLTLDSLVIGHTEEQGSCTGDCVSLDYCDDVLINYCDLYGCGAYALTTSYTDRISIVDTDMHDCTYGVAVLDYSDLVRFSRCAFYDCREFTMFELSESTVSFAACSFENLEGNLISVGGGSTAFFLLCELDDAAQASLEDNMAGGSNIQVIEDIPRG